MLRVRLLGDLMVEVDGSPVDQPRKQARPLAPRLAGARSTDALPFDLAALFWPDVLDESARTSLRSALSALRRALGQGSERYLIANRDEVGLAADELVWTDVGRVRSARGGDSSRKRSSSHAASSSPGLDDDWVVRAPRRAPRRVAASSRGLPADPRASATFGGDRLHATAGGARSARRGASARPDAAMAAAGDRAAAIRTYERFSRRFRDELRIAPSQATRELAEKLRHGTARGRASRRGPLAALEAPDVAPVAGGLMTLLFTDLVGSTELLLSSATTRPSACGACTSACCATWRSRTADGGQEPRRRTDGRVPERRERRELCDRNPAGGAPPQRSPGRRAATRPRGAQRRGAHLRRG